MCDELWHLGRNFPKPSWCCESSVGGPVSREERQLVEKTWADTTEPERFRAAREGFLERWLGHFFGYLKTSMGDLYPMEICKNFFQIKIQFLTFCFGGCPF